MSPCPILAEGMFNRNLDPPSHCVLNHVNCYKHFNDRARVGDDKEELSAVSMTQRLSKNKFVTFIYYKPDLKGSAQENETDSSLPILDL